MLFTKIQKLTTLVYRYRDRLREEMAEVEGATTMLERLSERSDVFFAISRAKHDGFPVQELPAFEVRATPDLH